MERKVADAAQELADALKQHVNEEGQLRSSREDIEQKQLAQEYKDFEKAVEARRTKMAQHFNDADDDEAVIDNPSGKYLRFAVEGDDYILKPGENKVKSYSIGIPATRVAALASAQLFGGYGITMSIVKGKSTINRERLMADMTETGLRESEDRAACEARIKAQADVKSALTATVIARQQSQIAADAVRATLPAPEVSAKSAVENQQAVREGQEHISRLGARGRRLPPRQASLSGGVPVADDKSVEKASKEQRARESKAEREAREEREEIDKKQRDAAEKADREAEKSEKTTKSKSRKTKLKK